MKIYLLYSTLMSDCRKIEKYHVMFYAKWIQNCIQTKILRKFMFILL